MLVIYRTERLEVALFDDGSLLFTQDGEQVSVAPSELPVIATLAREAVKK